ncbi:FGGY-family carbohydrate kinase [[Clostridium] hylemonae]|uniref:FGGY-family carbohydrate kinase n=1 Tax=[Clostridium] hylemonae TaxID=89153 RepID=UPI0011057A0B|nr:FGGY-family carbohydrate kinase [[Clostridium] hylemonae]
MKQEHIVLTFDVGTQSSRAMLINSRGDILAKAQETHEPPYDSPEPGFAEQRADFYYEHICRASLELKKSCARLWGQIEAVTVTTIRDTTVCVDENGSPLRPAIVWLDKRRAEGRPAMSQMTRLMLKAVGMEETANLQFCKSHCNWIMQNEPDIWKRTYKYLLLSGYLTFKLTGNMADAAASLVGHLPVDAQNRSWQRKGALTRPVFDIPEGKLCDIKESGRQLGTITEQAARDTGLGTGLPVLATGSDKACEILGLGCVTKEKAAVGFGTTATVTYTMDRYVEPERFIPPYISIIPGCFTPEIEIYRGYWLISWFKKEFAQKEVKQAAELKIPAEELLNERLKEIPAGCDGLLFQPYFTPNVTMPAARGAIIGFSDQHTRIHIYRAIVEGINFALMDGMRLMERRTGHTFKEIRLGGGGSRSDEICRITADMFGIPVIRTQTYEVTGVGSAMTAYVGMGVFKDYEEAVCSMVHVKDVFEPDMKQHEIYEELYENVFRNIYGRLSPLYTKLNEIYR